MPWGLKQKLSFFFYLLSHEPVKDARIILSTHSLSLPHSFLPGIQWTIFLLALAFFLFHAASLQQRSGTRTILSFGWTISWLLLELSYSGTCEESVLMFREGIRNETILGSPWLRFWIIDSESWGYWGLGYLMKIFVYNLTINSIVKTFH